MGDVMQAGLWHESERRRLVRLCAVVSGDREAAEDLAQETLLEAWRNVDKLRDPAGADRWLAAIARNVCLRWSRRRGRDRAVSLLAGGARPTEAFDVEVELDRAELADLLDRALALLPPVTRDVLVHRFVHERTHAEIGARLGLSEDAVSMRVSRGKIVMRRVLASDLRDEAAAYGLVEATDGDWRSTRVWCADCGRRTLVTRRTTAPDVISFRCPGCNPHGVGAAFSLGNPFFARLLGDVIRPTAILSRAAEWSRRYFAAGSGAEKVACTRCGEMVQLRRFVRDRHGQRCDGLYADCEACGEQVSSSVRGLAHSSSEVREFRRRHPRTRVLPESRLEFAGRPAILVRYEDLLGSARAHVLFAHDTLRVLEAASD